MELLDRRRLRDAHVVEDPERAEDRGREKDALEVDALADERDQEGDLLVSLERGEAGQRGEAGGKERREREGRARPPA
jgi:hypothetical protein